MQLGTDNQLLSLERLVNLRFGQVGKLIWVVMVLVTSVVHAQLVGEVRLEPTTVGTEDAVKVTISGTRSWPTLIGLSKVIADSHQSRLGPLAELEVSIDSCGVCSPPPSDHPYTLEYPLVLRPEQNPDDNPWQIRVYGEHGGTVFESQFDVHFTVETFPEAPSVSEETLIRLRGHTFRFFPACPTMVSSEFNGSTLFVEVASLEDCGKPGSFSFDVPLGQLPEGSYEVEYRYREPVSEVELLVQTSFAVAPTPTPPSHCETQSETLCFQQGRFEAEAAWEDFAGGAGSGQTLAVEGEDSGAFWFFDPDNAEVLVKVLDGCTFNNHYWVFAAAATNVEYNLTVTDRANGDQRSYSNPLGVQSPAITDTSAFPCTGVVTGQVLDWNELGSFFFDDFTDATTELEGSWSCNFPDPLRVSFYSWNFPDAEIALAPGISEISQMSDASSLAYESDASAGPVGIGEFVFVRHLTTGFYGAFRLDGGLCPTDGQQGMADVTWYLQENGSADFSTMFQDE